MSNIDVVIMNFRQVFLRLASLAILAVSLYIQITCNNQDACLRGQGDCPNIQVTPISFKLNICVTSPMSLVMRKPNFCIYENKDADQLRGYREADQRLCFRYTDSTIPLLPKSEISSFLLSSVALQPGLCRTWSETPKMI